MLGTLKGDLCPLLNSHDLQVHNYLRMYQDTSGIERPTIRNTPRVLELGSPNFGELPKVLGTSRP